MKAIAINLRRERAHSHNEFHFDSSGLQTHNPYETTVTLRLIEKDPRVIDELFAGKTSIVEVFPEDYVPQQKPTQNFDIKKGDEVMYQVVHDAQTDHPYVHTTNWLKVMEVRGDLLIVSDREWRVLKSAVVAHTPMHEYKRKVKFDAQERIDLVNLNKESQEDLREYGKPVTPKDPLADLKKQVEEFELK